MIWKKKSKWLRNRIKELETEVADLEESIAKYQDRLDKIANAFMESQRNLSNEGAFRHKAEQRLRQVIQSIESYFTGKNP